MSEKIENEFAKQVSTVNLEDEMKQSYLDYAMSVIVGRALPDVRDGLKPVHRRILYMMDESGFYYNRKHVKSARIVGEVMGKLHPHGDSAIYDTMVRMAQPFSMRGMLIDGQGNFGSIDGDSAAAMRYTEARMSKLAQQLLADINKETVNFVPNYDNNEVEPTVLPTQFPNLLVNGGTGIAVGMATNIPTHNLAEVINACLLMLDDSEVSMDALLTVMPGPDFPTGAMINGAEGIRKAYETGKGRLHIRSKTHIETSEHDGRQSIIVDELPYQVNKAKLLEKISELVKEKAIEGISALRDESDKDGIRMVIELKRGEVAEVILNNLYRQTQLQTVFGINMVALLDGRPQLLDLKTILRAFLKHRREVVTRRTIFDLRKAKIRAHILEGLATALNNIDEIIETIKQSSGPAEAKSALLVRSWAAGQVADMLVRAGSENSRPEDLPKQYGLHGKEYFLSPEQAQAILDLRLHRLTGLEQDKIHSEYQEIISVIEDLLDILTRPERLIEVIRDELTTVRDNYADPRRTVIIDKHLDLTLEDLIAQEDLVVTWSHQGYVKSQPLTAYEAQKRGGRGKSATATKDDDFIERVFVANTHDTLLSFTNKGKLYWTKVYELPQAGRNAKGRPIVNILNLSEGEKVEAVMAIQAYDANQFIFFVTRKGQVKKTPLTAYQNQRSNGIIAINLRDDDELLAVALTDGQSEVMLFSDNGKVVRFAEDAVRSMGRTASGVRGIRLRNEGKVVGLVVVSPEQKGDILTVTENGFGKRTDLSQYPVRSRGTQGVISIQTSERNGQVVSAVLISEDEDAMLITDGGVLIRTKVAGVSKVGRNTQGVRLIRLDKKEKLIALVRLAPEADDDGEIDTSRLIDTAEQLSELGDADTSYANIDEADIDEADEIDGDDGEDEGTEPS